MASSNNPRKFSEKIALHTQKQAEETAAFEEVMKDLNISRAARVRAARAGGGGRSSVRTSGCSHEVRVSARGLIMSLLWLRRACVSPDVTRRA